MEAGENSVNIPTYYSSLFIYILDLSNLCLTLSTISVITHDKAELRLIENILRIVHSNASTALLVANQTDKLVSNEDSHQVQSRIIVENQYNNLLRAHTKIWEQLTYKHRSTEVRNLLYKYLTVLVSTIYIGTSLLQPDTQDISYKKPKITTTPSVHSQVVTNPTNFIDPYNSSLQSNYYYPLLQMTPISEKNDPIEESNDLLKTPNPPNSSGHKKPPPITVESSIETLTDLLENMEEDELPVQSQSTQEAIDQVVQAKPTYYKHRFSIYRKSSSNIYPAATLSQLTLFKTFCKCLKSIDNQTQILPLRNDIKINPLTTTDQINNLEEVGVPNYFRAYKRTKRTLSGDFYIGTKFTFEELIENSHLLTWFMQHGYNITLNGCQSSDMVRIGLLTRVRGFTYRDDLRPSF